MINGIMAVIIAYLLGSIPSAYIITRWKTGKDIRKIGGGNVGANNVYSEVGLGAAIIVGFFDMAKGAVSVLIAGWLIGYPKPWLFDWVLLPWNFESSTLFILAAGLAAVVGHIWSIYLKFTGGNGIATTIGVLSILLTRELGIALAVSLLLMVITHNLILSINISLLISIPVFTWFLQKAWLPVGFALILVLILVLHFLPTAVSAINKAGSKGKLTAELMRVDTDKKSIKKKRN
jgi:glycerol-3-phosphate acyltransferase PlsY